MKTKTGPNQSSGADKRRARRRPILATFSLFVVVPRKGAHRLQVHDLSELGVGFDFDIEGESLEDFKVSRDDAFELHLYLNQSLYLPLLVQITRIEEKGAFRRVGAEFMDKGGKGYKAYASFLKLLDEIAEIAEIAPGGSGG